MSAPPVRRIRPAEHRRMPWKNGGGTTNEILVVPETGPFRYRLSIADVARSGPFSLFPGYDRHILLLEGTGMMIDAGRHGHFPLGRHRPQEFSGDWEVTGTLVDGPVRDFNLMVDRAWATSSLAVAAVTAATRYEADVCLVHVLEGAAAGDTLVAEGSLVVEPEEAARVAVGLLRVRAAGR